ncbi:MULTISPECIES: PLP-dependent transferase [unclassified Lentimonas]|uniref:PLP-dependent transferase n=1 Tax=unclassified Lentimonas TaxID=2630993 RepID=UPI0013281AD2|nr:MULTISPECIES: PLP-dependent transferase [unclassified Lentimonas]CAA6692077.1 Cystathionine gamma-synthase (EC [Lentimonas sp. CC10]CAA6693956.1 Cystathionine gamma-synthase (EC [Lentimonas sp. CC19]CAA7070239.1 Cystathionine gamma-synthase (EC [Lentimonas sp. CC11]
MDSLRHFPLGSRFPDSPHAVISSLPTLKDVCGYEEHDPRVLSALKSGYPRFVTHEYVELLIEFYVKRAGLVGRAVVLVDSRRAVDDALVYLGARACSLQVDGSVYILYCDASDVALVKRIKKYVQHTGCSVYSRQAEDLLVKHGLLSGQFDESVVMDGALVEVERVLAEQIGCQVEDVLLCTSGMNAFYAGFRSVQACQRRRGRTAWVQLGWLYLDSGCVLKEFLSEGETLDYSYDVFDVDAIIEKLRAYGDSLAAVVVECPSNPLIRVCEVHRIAAVVRELGGVMVIDPTIASVFSVDVLPCADLLITSLTKYAASEGDVMSGALAVNQSSPFYRELVDTVGHYHVPVYQRDAQRLAYELETAPAVVAEMNANASRLCAFFKGHPAVEHIYCAGCSDHIEEVAKPGRLVGAVISIELKGDMERFYDSIRLMKGPSFGARFTLLCPFMYLAHYDLVTSDEGRLFLADVGLDPELIRVSVGAEPYEELEQIFNEALLASIAC